MKSKKIVMFVASAGILLSAYAQQPHSNSASIKGNGGTKVTNSNVERSRLVNEKIAADKANATAYTAKSTNAVASRPGVPGLAPKPAEGTKRTPSVLQSKKQAPPTPGIMPAKASVPQTPAPAANHTGIRPGNQTAEQVKQQKAEYAAQHPVQRNNQAKVAPQRTAKGIIKPQNTAPAVTK